ncbi:eukaryotic translation initiation factor 5B [Stomoxys calcitrans]|uniref:eukaryotic translation initiation factor 5B n=1 Tax=Stomoxys calcitrans TaxID=35570 RepID=UPI0027E253C2|nr:eukaryotic translation initiation factor 5B [Stomoxys calcitrans]
MVKNKKGKKEIVLTGPEASSGDEIETTQVQAAGSDDSDGGQELEKVNAKNKKNKPQKKQNSKKKQNDSDGDGDSGDEVETISKGVKKLQVKSKPAAANSEDGEDEEEQASKKMKNKKKAAAPKKSAFELLMDEDDDDDDHNPPAAPPSEPEVEEEEPEKAVKNAGKKSKKAKRKGKDDDDEDLDKLLADIQAEYAVGEAPKDATANVVSPEDLIEEDFGKGKKKNKKQQQKETVKPVEVETNDGGDGEGDDIEEEGGTVKTAAQKKKEKKERQKREAALAKQKAAQEPKQKPKPVEEVAVTAAEEPTVAAEIVEEPKDAAKENEGDAEGETAAEGEAGKATGKNKKKGKKDKKAEEEETKKDSKKKGVSAAMVAAMQERLKKIKEEEERERQLEEERIKQEEERERQRLEAIRLEAERKEKKKQKEIERKARLKAEGKLLTKKQKEDRARAQAMLESLKAKGIEIPDPNEKRPTRPGTRIRPKKKGPQAGQQGETKSEEELKAEQAAAEAAAQAEAEKKEVIKDSWDATDSEEEANDEVSQATTNTNDEKAANGNTPEEDESDDDDDDDNDDDEDSEDDRCANSDSDSDLDDKDEVINANDPEERRLRAERRILKRQDEAEKKRTVDNLRAAVVCVLGHVDTGKTKILDKLRRTNVQDGEAGGITQQIGATNVPMDAIKEQSKVVRNSSEFEYKLPGLLIIDTPGHESFSNLRNRGSSLCDIAILVVDIMHGLEPQTIESINLLKKKKCPFIVALNKIDRLYDWKLMARRDIRDVLKEQEANTQVEFNQRTKEVILQFAEQGLNAALFYENPDPKTYISLVPTSAITGEGMGNLLFLIVEFCQKMLAKRLMYSEELQATVLEVKAIPGLGTTIDAILINGKLREGQTMILAGTDGPIVTQIRSLLMPQPMKELRVKNAYVEHKEVLAAQGVKIAAKDLEKAIAGINLLIAHKPDEVEICKEEVARELKSALSHIKLASTGVYVQASTLGSLEALLEFLRTSKIPYSAIRIGPVVKRDVMKASTMLEHESQYATILAFDVKVEKEAQEMADTLGVKIFQADIIYHLFDKFMAYREELKQKKRDEFKSIAVFPCKLKILPQFIFNSRDPIVMGVMVENGIVKVGTPICVPSKEFVDIGIVTSIESNHKQIESARKGQEICIKLDPIPGESPKMFGRHFEADDMLVSKISRQSIDACKDYFRDDLIKADWALMVELKKLFQIL